MPNNIKRTLQNRITLTMTSLQMKWCMNVIPFQPHKSIHESRVWQESDWYSCLSVPLCTVSSAQSKCVEISALVNNLWKNSTRKQFCRTFNIKINTTCTRALNLKYPMPAKGTFFLYNFCRSISNSSYSQILLTPFPLKQSFTPLFNISFAPILIPPISHCLPIHYPSSLHNPTTPFISLSGPCPYLFSPCVSITTTKILKHLERRQDKGVRTTLRMT